jgi:hypothetical protein
MGCAAVLAFALSAIQSFIVQDVGSDHPVHVFLTQRIRGNRFRLFVRIPDLLNDCYCGAVPLYIHWVIAHFRVSAIYWCERLLNPAVNLAHVLLVAAIATFIGRDLGIAGGFAGSTALLFALTPQFYHALSARNFGLSARGTGLLLLTTFLAAAYATSLPRDTAAAWTVLVVTGWLIWGFSTFAQQSLCMLSVLLWASTGRRAPFIGAIAGLAVFLALHPAYAIGYLRSTAAFMRKYATELAPVYILQRRKSIWRDLVWDIWRKFGERGLAQALRYAYENSVVVVVLLNPFTPLCCWAALTGSRFDQGPFGYCLAITVCGAVAAFLTSFRATRFLGEPERYVEAVSAWATLFGAHVLYEFFGSTGAAVGAVGFLAVDVAQIGASRLLTKVIGNRAPDLRDIEESIEQRWGSGARVCSNNEHFTKMMMQHDWQYAYCFAVGPLYCGMTAAEAFSTFPMLRREACERIAETFRINACLLDREVYETLFDDPPAGLMRMQIAHESSRFRLLFLDWN